MDVSIAAVLEKEQLEQEGACDIFRKTFARGAFSLFLPSLSWSSSKTLMHFSITRASPDPSFQELNFSGP